MPRQPTSRRLFRAVQGANLKDGSRVEPGGLLDIDDVYGAELVAMGIAEEVTEHAHA